MKEPTRLIAANDNAPRDAGEFQTLAERRTWLSTLPEKAQPVMAWPTLERLARLPSPSAAAALWQYAKLMDPHRLPIADNDNDPDASDLDVELRHEIRPSEDELVAAAADGMRTFVRADRRPTGWHIVARQEAVLIVDGSNVQLGNLKFRGGKLVSWGATSRGNDLRPIERQRMPRGSAVVTRSEADIRRDLLPTNDNTPIAKGAYWFGGKKGKKGTVTKPDIGDHAAAEELARNQRREYVRMRLGNKVWILDAAITDATAREIGELLGFTGKTAERHGISAINDAIAEFEKIAA